MGVGRCGCVGGWVGVWVCEWVFVIERERNERIESVGRLLEGEALGEADAAHPVDALRRHLLRHLSTRERVSNFFSDNPLVRINLIIAMMRWTGLAPWEVVPHPPALRVRSDYLF